MAGTTAPLLSFDARGQLGKTLVYSSWKGRAYARRYVIPSNPQTAAQSLTRDVFRGLNKLWQYLPATATAAWELYADNSRITARNGWLKANVSALRSEADLTAILLSTAAGGGLALGGVDITATAGGATMDVAIPELPTGWALAGIHAVAVAQVDPHSIETPEVHADSDDAAPWQIAMTGLTAAQPYVVGVWASYTKPDGSLAYSASVQEVITPT